MLSQKQIDDLAEIIQGELDVLTEGNVYIWKNKESRDRGLSWTKTNRIEVYETMLAVLTEPEPAVVEPDPPLEDVPDDDQADDEG